MENVSVFVTGIVVLRLDEGRHHTSLGFDPERKRRDVEQHDVFHVAGDNAPLNRGTDRDHFVGIDPLMWLFPTEQLLHEFMHERDSRRTADKHDFVDLLGRELGIFQCLLNRFAAAARRGDQ